MVTRDGLLFAIMILIPVPNFTRKKNKFTEISFNANTDYLQYVNPLRNEIINSSEQTLVTQPEAK